MIYAELLKLRRSKEIVLAWILWLVMSAVICYLLNYSFINPKVYAAFGYRTNYVVYQHAFLKTSLYLANIFLLTTLMIQRKWNSAKITERKKTLPIDLQKIQIKELLALHILGFSLTLFITVISSVFICFWFAKHEDSLYILSAFLMFLGFALVTTASSISIFFMLIKLFRSKMVTAFIFLTVCLASFVVKVFPVQWGANMLSEAPSVFGSNYVAFFLCLVLIFLPFVKAKMVTISYFISGIVCLFSVLSCTQKNTNKLDLEFKPTENIVYIAFSLECSVCNDKLLMLSKITELKFEKIVFISVDSKQEIEFYKKAKNLSSRINFKLVDERKFKYMFDSMSFPQAIIFRNGTKNKINESVA